MACSPRDGGRRACGNVAIGRGPVMTGMGVRSRRLMGRMILLLHRARVHLPMIHRAMVHLPMIHLPMIHLTVVLCPGGKGGGGKQQRRGGKQRLHAASSACRMVTTRIIPACMCINMWQ